MTMKMLMIVMVMVMSAMTTIETDFPKIQKNWELQRRLSPSQNDSGDNDCVDYDDDDGDNADLPDVQKN